MSIPWKEWSQLVSDIHKEHGACAINAALQSDLTAYSGEDIEKLTPENQLEGNEGRTVTPKRIRQFLWKHRKAVIHKKTCVWTVYNPEDNRTYIGLAILEPESAQKAP